MLAFRLAVGSLAIAVAYPLCVRVADAQHEQILHTPPLSWTRVNSASYEEVVGQPDARQSAPEEIVPPREYRIINQTPSATRRASPTAPAQNDLGVVDGDAQILDLVKYAGAPLPEALELFANQTELNVVASQQAAQATVSLSIRNVTAVQALDAIAKSCGLWYRRDKGSGVYYLYANGEKESEPALDGARLEVLEREINDTFPDSLVQLSLIGEQIVVRGQAHDFLEANEILALIKLHAPRRDDEKGGERPTVNISQRSLLPNASELGVGISNIASSLSEGLLGDLSPGATIVNLLHIPGEQQVALRVTVAEVSRNAAREVGLNFGINNNQGTPIFRSLVGGVAAVGEMGNLSGGNMPVLLDNGQVQLAIHALRQLSLARTLAEPTLTTLNGRKARFHAGGQFPVPVVTGFTDAGLQGVTFVPFGVQLNFTPYITDGDRIRLEIYAEVSVRDEALATAIGGDAEAGGTQVPGLESRNFETTVELREGQTLAVAGLIQNNFGGKADRVPFFGDLPLIGRGAAFDRLSAGEQELVILITPELVRAIDPHTAPPLPGSDVFEPDDIEFYLGGRLEGRRPENYRSQVRTDFQKQENFVHCEDIYIIGPHGYSCGDQSCSAATLR